MKKLFLLIFLVLTVLLTALPAFAANEYMVNPDGILTASQQQKLSDELAKVSDKYDVDVVAVIIDSLGGVSARNYADDYFDYNGYGRGSGRDGILLLISDGDGDYAFSTRGYGITAFTDYGLERIFNNISDDLYDGDYARAFETYADECDTLLGYARDGEPYDVGSEKLPLGMAALIAVAIGCVVSFIILSVMKHGMTTVRSNNAAADYMRRGSMRVTEAHEMFLYRNVTRVKRDTDSGSGKGGGSSTHISSSGATHGGRSGSFR